MAVVSSARSTRDEPRDLFGAAPRQRVARAAVAVVVDEAALALESHFAARRPKTRSRAQRIARIEPEPATPIEDPFRERGVGAPSVVPVSRNRAASEHELTAARDHVENRSPVAVIGQENNRIERRAVDDHRLPEVRVNVTAGGELLASEPRAAAVEVAARAMTVVDDPF